MRKPDVSAYYRVVPYGDSAEYGRVGVDRHVVFQYGVTWTIHHVALSVVFEALCTKCHSLIECHVVADD